MDNPENAYGNTDNSITGGRTMAHGIFNILAELVRRAGTLADSGIRKYLPVLAAKVGNEDCCRIDI